MSLLSPHASRVSLHCFVSPQLLDEMYDSNLSTKQCTFRLTHHGFSGSLRSCRVNHQYSRESPHCSWISWCLLGELRWDPWDSPLLLSKPPSLWNKSTRLYRELTALGCQVGIQDSNASLQCLIILVSIVSFQTVALWATPRLSKEPPRLHGTTPAIQVSLKALGPEYSWKHFLKLVYFVYSESLT